MNSAPPKQLDPAFLIAMADALRILAHPHRLRIIELLDIRGETPVHELVRQLELPQASVSNHLNKMKRAGLIADQRQGKEIWYRLANPNALTILNCMRKQEKSS